MAANTNCGKILIVDDDAGYRAFVASIFERVGSATRHAKTADEALNAARNERPSCILLDVHLPGMTGYQVCRELREEYGEAFPIIFVTGERTEPADRVAGLLLGADDYVVKPLTRTSSSRAYTGSSRDRATGLLITTNGRLHSI